MRSNVDLYILHKVFYCQVFFHKKTWKFKKIITIGLHFENFQGSLKKNSFTYIFNNNCMKKILAGSVIASSLLLASCGSDSNTTTGTTTQTTTTTVSTGTTVTPAATPTQNATPTQTATTTTTTTTTKKDFFEDKAALEKAYDDLAKMPNLAGKSLKFFQDIHFYNDGRIKIAIQEPNKPENIDEYNYKNGTWGQPEPLQITGDGDMSANVAPFNKETFARVADIRKTWLEKQKEVEGSTNPLTHVYLNLLVSSGDVVWYTETMQGTRSQYNLYLKEDGSVKEFKKQ